MRYEVETPYSERYDHLFYGFDYYGSNPVQVPGMSLRGAPLFAGIGGNPHSQGSTDFNNFGPRVGFAWRIRPGTVLRGGYGLFYASNIGNLDTTINIPSTFSTNISDISSQDRGFTPFTTLADPFPAGILKPVGNTLGRPVWWGRAFPSWRKVGCCLTRSSGSLASSTVCPRKPAWSWRSSGNSA